MPLPWHTGLSKPRSGSQRRSASSSSFTFAITASKSACVGVNCGLPVPGCSKGVEKAGVPGACRQNAPGRGSSGVAPRRGAPAVCGIAVRRRRRATPMSGVRSRHPGCVVAVPRCDPERRNSDPAPAGVDPRSRSSDPAPSGGPPREPEERPRAARGPPREPEERPRAVRGPPREPEERPRAVRGPPRKPEERPHFSRPGPRKAEETPRSRRGPPRAAWGSPRGRRGCPRNREAPAFFSRRRHSARPERQNRQSCCPLPPSARKPTPMSAALRNIPAKQSPTKAGHKHADLCGSR